MSVLINIGEGEGRNEGISADSQISCICSADTA